MTDYAVDTRLDDTWDGSLGDVDPVSDETILRIRLLVVAVAALAALSYAWAINRAPLEPYYAAAVRSMSTSWHNFFFGSFDPAGTITLDKLPGAFWVQALSVWIFGFHTWAVVLPQVIEGVIAVVVLYRAVERLMGPHAGLVAAVVLAASPASVALNRGNISDTAMTLLLVLAANSVSAALVSGRQRDIVLAGIWIGLAFQTKMIEAWLVLPAFGLAYLLGGPGPWLRKLRQLLVGALAVAVLSLAWMTVVTALPTSGRPYVDGSAHDSVYDQVFVYNGFGRFGQQTPLQLLAGQGLDLGLVSSPAPAWNRLISGDMGRDTGWLLPAALVAGVAGLWTRRRSYYTLWGGWLVTMVVVFSATSTVNAYYTGALSPPIAALIGAGAARLWARRRELRAAATSGGGVDAWVVGAAVVVAGTVGYGLWLAATAPGDVPSWVLALAAGVGVAAVALLAALALRISPLPRSAGLGAAVALGAVAMLVIPAAGAAQLVSDQRGAFDTPFESAAGAAAVQQLFVKTPRDAAATIPGLERVQLGADYLLAAQTSAIASVFISASGKEALPIGGFTGTIPSPTLAQLKADITAGKFHLVLAAASRDPRLAWVESHCPKLGVPVGTLQPYFCLPRDVAAGG